MSNRIRLGIHMSCMHMPKRRLIFQKDLDVIADKDACPTCNSRLESNPMLDWIGLHCIVCGWTFRKFNDIVKDADDSAFIETGWYNE